MTPKELSLEIVRAMREIAPLRGGHVSKWSGGEVLIDATFNIKDLTAALAKIEAPRTEARTNAFAIQQEQDELRRDAARWRLARRGHGDTKWLDVWDEDQIDAILAAVSPLVASDGFQERLKTTFQGKKDG